MNTKHFAQIAMGLFMVMLARMLVSRMRKGQLQRKFGVPALILAGVALALLILAAVLEFYGL